MYAYMAFSMPVTWFCPCNSEYCMQKVLTCNYMHAILHVVKRKGGDKNRDSGATWSEDALPMSYGSGVLDVEQQNRLSLVDGLLAHLQDLESQMEDLKGKRDAVVTTIASLQGKDSPQTKTQPRRATRSTPRPQLPDLTGLEVDLNGAPNLFERLVRIAKVVDGRTINVTQVSKFLVSIGESEADFRNLSAGVGATLKKRPDLFRKTHPGTYEYLGEEEVNVADHEDPLE